MTGYAAYVGGHHYPAMPTMSLCADHSHEIAEYIARKADPEHKRLIAEAIARKTASYSCSMRRTQVPCDFSYARWGAQNTQTTHTSGLKENSEHSIR